MLAFVIYVGMVMFAAKEHEVHLQVKPPEHCQFFDDRYSPEYKAMCDKWEKEHGND